MGGYMVLAIIAMMLFDSFIFKVNLGKTTKPRQLPVSNDVKPCYFCDLPNKEYFSCKELNNSIKIETVKKVI